LFHSQSDFARPRPFPDLLFHGLEGSGATSEFWMDALKLAPILNQITEASCRYLLQLRNKGGDFEILGK